MEQMVHIIKPVLTCVYFKKKKKIITIYRTTLQDKVTRTTKITSLQIICINILYKDNWKFCGHLVYNKDSGIIS